MHCGLSETLNIVHAHALAERFQAVGARSAFQAVAQNHVNLGHPGEGFRIDLRRAAGDDDPGVRSIPAHAPNGLPRLTHRLPGNRTSIDDHSILETVLARPRQSLITLIRIQSTPEGDNSQPIVMISRRHVR